MFFLKCSIHVCNLVSVCFLNHAGYPPATVAMTTTETVLVHDGLLGIGLPIGVAIFIIGVIASIVCKCRTRLVARLKRCITQRCFHSHKDQHDVSAAAAGADDGGGDIEMASVLPPATDRHILAPTQQVEYPLLSATARATCTPVVE